MHTLIVFVGLLLTGSDAMSSATTAVVNGIQATSGSTEGGTYFTVWGSGFNRGGQEGSTVVYIGSSVCDTVEYYSTDSMIVCFTPAGPLGSMDVTVQVLALADGRATFATNVGSPACGDGKCPFRLTYSGTNTPNVYASALGGYSNGGVAGFWGYLVGTSSPWYQVHVGSWDAGFRCDVSDDIQLNFPRTLKTPRYVDSNGNGAIRCTIGPSEAGVYNMSFEIRDPNHGLVNGYGQIARQRFAKQVSAAAGVYQLTVVASVTGVEAGTAGLLGGGSVVVSGSGFSSTPNGNAVYLLGGDGAGGNVWVPCAVTASTASTITCTPGAAAGSTAFNASIALNVTKPFTPSNGLLFSGGAGLLHLEWDGSWAPSTRVGDYFGAQRPTGAPTMAFLNADSVQGVTRNENTNAYTQVLAGWFVPPVTANFSFYVRGDDSAAVWLSSDDTRARLKVIAYTQSYEANLYKYPSQTSTPQWLVAGQRYWFQVQHQQTGGGGEYFDVGMRVFTANNAEATAFYGTSNPLVTTFGSTPDVQNIATSTTVVREQQAFVVAGAASGSWAIKVGSRPLVDASGDLVLFAPDATKEFVRAKLVKAIDGCDDITVVRAAFNVSVDDFGTVASGFKWTVTIKCAAPFPAPGQNASHAVLTPLSATLRPQPGLAEVFFSTEVVVPASNPLQGSFLLGLPASLDPNATVTWTAPIPALGNSWDVYNALSAIGAPVGFEVNALDSGCAYGDCSKWQVTFYGTGDMPQLLTDGADLVGSDAVVTAFTWQDGSNDPFLLPIPVAGYFEAPHTTPAVRVVSNGLVAACPTVASSFAFSPTPGADLKGTPDACSFLYSDALTPVITGISPGYATATNVINVTAGTALTITGTGFLDASDGGLLPGGNLVAINASAFGGASVCNVTAATSTSITCTIPDAPAGTHTLTVTVGGGRGTARLTLGVSNALLFVASVSSASPPSGSTAGGTLVTIYGTGLATPVGDATSVSFDGVGCKVVSYSLGQLVCMTGPSAAGTLAVLSLGGQSWPGVTFSYDAAMTPVVTALSPVVLSAAKSGRVNVTITLPPAASGVLTAPPPGTLVTFGSRPCTLSGNWTSAPGSLLLSCILLRGAIPATPPATLLAPVVYLPPYGNADAAGSVLDASFYATNAALGRGSLSGGTNVTIYGVGFSAPASSVAVVFYPAGSLPSDPGVLSLARPCEVTAVADDGTSLQCTTSAPAVYSAADASGYFAVTVNRVMAPPSAGPLNASLTFTYAASATPVFRTLTVTGSAFALTGENLQAPLAVTFKFASALPAGVTSPVFSAVNVVVSGDGLSASGSLPSLSAGQYQLGGYGPSGVAVVNATATPTDAAVALGTDLRSLFYAAPLAVTDATFSASGAVGSVAGGHQLTLYGNGFVPSDTSALGYTVVRMCVGGVCTTATPVSSTTTAAVFRTPPYTSATVGGVFIADVVVYVCSDAACLVTPQLALAVTSAGAYTYGATLADTPVLSSASPRFGPVGTLVTLRGDGFNVTQPNGAAVTLGGAPCLVATWNATVITCAVGAATPAGAHRVLVSFPLQGLAKGPTAGVFFTTPLTVSGPASPSTGGFGGGAQLTVRGSGFATAATGGSNAVVLCNQYCTVTASAWDSINCTLPAIVTPASLDAFNTVQPASLRGVPFGFTSTSYPGTANSAAAASAFDGSVATGFSGVCRLGLDFGAPNTALVTSVRWYAPFQGKANFAGGKWQASTLPAAAAKSSSDWTTIASVGATTEAWNTVDLYNGQGQNVTSWAAIPGWRSVQFVFASGKTCAGLELQVVGVLAAAAASANSGACAVNVTVTGPTDAYIGAAAATSGVASGGPYVYSQALTPVVTAISPDNSTALGGTVVTLTGSGFGSTIAGTAVAFNGVPCAVTAVAPTAITCVTGVRDAIRPLSVSVSIPGSGLALYNSSTVYMRYLDRWSALTTWANQEPPGFGDTVIVPQGQAILVDISPPELFLVLVEGALVFGRVDGLTFDAHYFIAVGGSIEAGRKNDPHLNTLTITLHGDRYTSVELPDLGAKVLGIMNRMPLTTSTAPVSTFGIAGSPAANQASLDAGGLPSSKAASTQANSALGSITSAGMGGDMMGSMFVGSLDLHGAPRKTVWTKLAATAAAGSNTLSLTDPVDWAPGETIVITSSSWDATEAEELTVVALLSPTQVLVSPELAHTHESYIAPAGQWGHSDVDMRCEVGLLSRNIVVQGDGASDAQLFGCHTIAMHGGYYRLENIEVRKCGQSFNLGRYATHMHLLGAAGSDSYVRHNSIHHSFQRMTTVHASDYTTVEGNFGYMISGHALFLEDGVEKYNVLEGNLIARTFPCAACLESDLKPASFWTASPTNFWRNNVAAGCTHDGYWFELPGNPNGPSFTTTICPVGNPLGEFFNNAAHSNGVHGIRLYPTVTPFVNPCKGEDGVAPQYFYNFTSFRNGAHGIFGKTNGALRHVNAKLVENRGDDFHQVRYVGVYPGRQNLFSSTDPNLDNSLLIGTLEPVTRPIWNKRAMWTPQNEYFFVRGVTMVNYGDTGAISACNDCANEALGIRPGGYTVRFEDLSFVNSAKRILYTWPFKDILFDVDGTLTGKGPSSWAVAPFGFNDWPECPVDTTGVWDYGNVCDNSVVVRRAWLDSVKPNNINNANVRVESAAGKGVVKFLPTSEVYGWTWPFVSNKLNTTSGKDYAVLFETLSDWRTLRFRYAEPAYIASGEWALLQFRWTDKRYRNQVWYQNNAKLEVPALPVNELPTSATMFGTGTTFFGTEAKNWTVGLSTGNLNGSNPFANEKISYAITVNDLQCDEGATFNGAGCAVPPKPSISSNLTLWSVAFKNLPPGSDVTINATSWIELDVTPPPLGLLTILGRLTVQDSRALSLTAAAIVVWGEFYVGSPAVPHANRFEIVLTGVRTSPAVIVDNNIFAGNKVFLVLGDVQVYGTPRNTTWVRLSATAAAGASVLQLAAPGTLGSWYPGDAVTITPTEFDLPMQEETAVIQSVSPNGLTVTLTKPLAYRHYAGPAVANPASTGGNKARIAAAVGLLSRNVIIRGNVSATDVSNPPLYAGAPAYVGPDTYGGHMLVAAVARASMPISDWRIGRATLSFAQLLNMGKGSMEYAAFAVQYGALTLIPESTPLSTQDLADLVPQPVNSLIGCSLSFTFNTGVQALGARNLVVDSSVIHRARRNGIDIDITSLNATITNTLVSNVLQSPDVNAAGTTQWVWPSSGVFVDAPTVRSVTGNLVAGSNSAGFTFHPETTCAASASAAAAAGFPPSGTAAPTWGSNEATATVMGVFALPTASTRAPGAGWCGLRLGNWTVTKAAHIGVLAVDALAPIALVHSLLAENHIGVSLNYVLGDRNQARTDVQDVVIVGSGPATASVNGTCPPSSSCRAFSKTDVDATGVGGCGSVLGGTFFRAGIMDPQYTNRGKTCFVDGGLAVCSPPNFPVKLCSLPWESRYGLPSTRATELYLTRVTFAGFADASDSAGCVATLSRAFVHNPSQVDMAPPVYATGIVWDGVPVDSRFSFATSWASEDASGGDGLRMILLSDVDGTLMGTPGSSVLGPNPPVGFDFPTCTYYNSWAGMYCPGVVLRQAIMESMDRDRGARQLGNLFVARLPSAAVNDTGSVSWLNRTSVARGPVNDMCPMRFYFAQYPFLVVPGIVVHVMWAGTEPGQTRFHMFSPNPSESVVFKFFVQRPNTIQSFANGVYVPPTGVLPNFASPHCFSLFDPQARHITVTLRGQANWAANPCDTLRLATVQLTVGLTMTTAQFYGGGEAQIVANLATLLGIDPRTIKTVNVAAAPAPLRRALLGSWWGLPEAGLSLGNVGARRLDESTTTVKFEIFPPTPSEPVSEIPNVAPSANSAGGASSSPLSGDKSTPPPANFTSPGDTVVQNLTYSDASVAIALSMNSIAESIVTLGSSGQASTLGGFPVTSLVVLPPLIPSNASTEPYVTAPTRVDLPLAPPSPEGSGSAGGLSIGAIAGIVVGSVAAVFLVLVGLAVWHRESVHKWGAVMPWASSRRLTNVALGDAAKAPAAAASGSDVRTPHGGVGGSLTTVVRVTADLDAPAQPLGIMLPSLHAHPDDLDAGTPSPELQFVGQNAKRGRGSPSRGSPSGRAGLARAASTRVEFGPVAALSALSTSMQVIMGVQVGAEQGPRAAPALPPLGSDANGNPNAINPHHHSVLASAGAALAAGGARPVATSLAPGAAAAVNAGAFDFAKGSGAAKHPKGGRGPY